MTPTVTEVPSVVGSDRSWGGAVRRYLQRYWPYDRLVPKDEPVYVARLFYVFGSMAMMSFLLLIITGVLLAFKGPYWWHTSATGLFLNSLHFWGVQVFFFTMFVHFGASFFTAAWRGGRGFTWILGVLTFWIAIFAGLTGYIMMGNYDGQFIGQQAKDPLNAAGLGGLINTLNMDSITGLHVVVLPLGLSVFLALHVLWVRRHGVAPPFPAPGTDFHGATDPEGPSALDASSSPRAGTRAGNEEVDL